MIIKNRVTVVRVVYLPFTPGARASKQVFTVARSTADGLAVLVTLVFVERTTKPSNGYVCRNL